MANINYDESIDIYGSIDVSCEPALYGTKQLTLNYTMHSEVDSETLSNILSFVQEHYRQAYCQVLDGVLSAYKNAPKWDVWIDEKKEFLRIDFKEKEELHPYIGIPMVDLLFTGGKIIWGLTFPDGTNKLSFEHGFCTVFEQETLLILADDDFLQILQWWDYYCSDGNELITRNL